jgi:formylglycine-generating enzyme
MDKLKSKLTVNSRFDMKIASFSLLVFIVLMSFSYDKSVKNLKNVPPTNMILVEGGKFMMGDATGEPDVKTLHQVSISNFYLDKYEVTNRQFCEFLNAKGNQMEEGAKWLDIEEDDCGIQMAGKRFVPKPGSENNPVIDVSWFGANAYAKWAGKRLPYEAEWEFAARGGNFSKKFKYSGGNDPKHVAWFDANAEEETHAVGQKAPNELGVYDLSGNAWEWCSDWYDEKYYSKSPGDNPKGPSTPDQNPLKKGKVMRGGAWISLEKELRVYIRDFNPPMKTFYHTGFRCAKDVN